MTGRRSSWRARAARLSRAEGGATAVEFALLAPALLILLAGLIDGARAISRSMQVRAAAQAGADYALRKGWNATAISAAVAGATNSGAVADPAPTQVTACVSGETIVPTGGASCPGGGSPGRFVTVRARAPYSPLMPWPGLSFPSGLTAEAVVRLP